MGQMGKRDTRVEKQWLMASHEKRFMGHMGQGEKAMVAKAVKRRATFIGVPEQRMAQAERRGEAVDVVNLHPTGLPHYDTVRFAGGEIARLARRGALEPHLVEAAERLAALHHAARMDGPRAVDPSKIVVDGGGAGAGDLTERVLDARAAFSEAMDACGALCRPVVSAIVIDGMTLAEAGRIRELSRNRRDRAVAALWVLKAGLDVLAKHFGLRRPEVAMTDGRW